MRRWLLAIDGMTAVHHVRAVYTAFAGVEGVTGAEVWLGGAAVDHDGRATRAAVEAAVALAGCAVREAREERRLPVV